MLPKNTVLIGYKFAKEDTIWPLVGLKDNTFHTIQHPSSTPSFNTLVDMRSKKRAPVTFERYCEEKNDNRSVWYAQEQQNKKSLGHYKFPSPDSSSADVLHLDTIVASADLEFSFRGTEEQTREFYSINHHCVYTGDYSPNHQPPCKVPQLIGFSDLNKNGNIEYWYIDHSLWHQGFGVMEIANGLPHIIAYQCWDCD